MITITVVTLKPTSVFYLMQNNHKGDWQLYAQNAVLPEYKKIQKKQAIKGRNTNEMKSTTAPGLGSHFKNRK